MADWQKKVRTERRDRYFYWTAVFGSEPYTKQDMSEKFTS